VEASTPGGTGDGEHDTQRSPWPIGLVLVVATLAILAGLSAATHYWKPPPPEFADTTNGSGLAAPVHDWEPETGDPEGVLDKLPPAGPAMADVDRNGLTDAFVPQAGYVDDDTQQARDTRSRLFLNWDSTRTEERFVDATDVADISVDRHAYAASWGDANDDGWPDLLVAGYGFAELYVNDRDGTFTEVTEQAGIPQQGLVTDAAWGDWDADGDLDLYLARYTPVDGDQPTGDLDTVPGTSDVLLRNDGGAFTDVSAELGIDDLERRSTTATFVDAPYDGRQDIYVTAFDQPAVLWEQTSEVTFTQTAGERGLDLSDQATCQAWADLDRDTRLDLVVGNADERARVMMQQADGTFVDRGGGLGFQATGEIPTWDCAAFDSDNDGDRDLLFTRSNVTGDQAATPRLYTNGLEDGGPLSFEDRTTDAGDDDPALSDAEGTITDTRAYAGMAIADLSLGKYAAEDVVTSTHRRDDVHVYRNVGWGGAWMGGNGDYLRLWLEGTTDNALGIGARVTVEAGDLTLVRQVGTTGVAHAASPIIFGLYKPYEAGYSSGGDVSVTVEWPSGDVDTYEDEFDIDTATRVVQGQGYDEDTVPPRVFLSLQEGEAGNPGWYTSRQVTLELSAQDEARGGSLPTGTRSLAYSLDGDTWTSVDPNDGAELTFDGEGTYPVGIEVTDEAGNTARSVYPVRIDTTPPEGSLEDPADGGVYVQGEQLQTVPGLEDRALVLAPRETPADDQAHQPVRTTAEDDNRVREIRYEVQRTDGRPTDASGHATRAPHHLWNWQANEVAAGEYTIVTTIEDAAGHETVIEPRVVVGPTTIEGLNATAQQGPSPIQP
jgi:hypothetical protein